jgi:glycerol-3-phosphate O-acyltransferase/dihydroxyacetone phosphate acyltransferase
VNAFYAVVRGIAWFWIWFFFERIEVRHPERVPTMGPVLLRINHPNNLIDSLLGGAVVPRKVHYLAIAALFHNPLVARFLVALGVIPVHRKADGPGQVDRRMEMFAACHQAFDQGRLIAIYPEGATRAEAQLQRIKTGAARIALGYEAHAPGRLTILPVGLSFQARKRFRGRVLVSFGEPVVVSPHFTVYRQEPVEALRALTAAIQCAMEREVVNVQRIDTAALARAVDALYRGEIERELWEARGLSGRPIGPFQLSGAIADAVEHFRKQDPERVERLWQRLLGHHAGLDAYRLRDEAVRTRLERPAERQRVAQSWQTIVGLPLFAYRELPPLLSARMARGADVAPANGLRDDPAPRECRRIPALLGAGDVAHRMGGRSPVGACLLPLTPARRADRVSVSGRHGAVAPPTQVRRAPPHARPGREASPR